VSVGNRSVAGGGKEMGQPLVSARPRGFSILLRKVLLA
jgi:hypothetical protein